MDVLASTTKELIELSQMTYEEIYEMTLTKAKDRGGDKVYQSVFEMASAIQDFGDEFVPKGIYIEVSRAMARHLSEATITEATAVSVSFDMADHFYALMGELIGPKYGEFLLRSLPSRAEMEKVIAEVQEAANRNNH